MASFKSFERSSPTTATTPTPRSALSAENLALIGAVSRLGSMAAAARELGMVPSALTYRVRQVEDALDVLLFDRSARRAVLTPRRCRAAARGRAPAERTRRRGPPRQARLHRLGAITDCP